VAYKIGDRVRFDPAIPRPIGWIEMTYWIVQLTPLWAPSSGMIMLARIQSDDGTVIDAVDTSILLPG
jgi:hypothetical protein